jgi:hypothetical protein
MSRYLKAQQRLIDVAMEDAPDRSKGRKPVHQAPQRSRRSFGKRNRKPGG